MTNAKEIIRFDKKRAKFRSPKQPTKKGDRDILKRHPIIKASTTFPIINLNENTV